MLALFLLAFGVMAAAKVNTVSVTSVRNAEVHASINNLAHEILEVLKADKANATNGTYNIKYGESVPTDGKSPLVIDLVVEWKSRVETELPGGMSMIECKSGACTVSLSWRERLLPGKDMMTYNVRASL